MSQALLQLINQAADKESPQYSDIWTFWATQLMLLTEARRNEALTEELLPCIARLDKLHREDALATVRRICGGSATALKQVSEEPVVTPSQYGSLRSWFQDVFFVLGHEQGEYGTGLLLWHKLSQRQVKVSLDRTVAHVKGVLAPYLGDLEAPLFQHLPGVPKPSDRFMAFMRLLYDQALNTPTLDDLVRLRNGLHATEEGVIMISRRRVARFTGTWEPITDPRVGKYIVETIPKSHDWLEFSAEELAAPLTISSVEAYKHLEAALLYGWTWSHPEDVQIIALSCFALTWGTVFATKPWLHIIGLANAGKSALGMGFIAGHGHTYRTMGGPFVPTAGAEESASSAGIRSKYAYTGQTLVVDEADPHSKPIQELLDLMRNSGTSGSGILRGTPDGGYRESYLYVPAVFIGTQPWTKDPDITRWLDINFFSDPERANLAPEIELYNFWQQQSLDPRELRRTILLSFLHNWQELQDEYNRLRRLPPETDAMTSRMRNNLLPQFACANILGLDASAIESTLTHTRREYTREIEMGRTEMQLRDVLVGGGFRMERGRTTVSQIALEGLSANDTAPYGVALGHSNKNHCRVLYVNWSSAQNAGPLYGTRFAGVEYPDSRALLDRKSVV